MLLRDLEDVRSLLDSVEGTFAGVGMTAFSRIVPASFIHPYRVVALRKTCDQYLLREKAHLFCLEAETRGPLRDKAYTSVDLLAHPLTRTFLRAGPNPTYLLLYQNYPELESLAQEEGWVLLANPASLRIQVGERAFFDTLLTDLELPAIPGGIYPIEVIHQHEYRYWADAISPRLVVQLPDIREGGGKGTFFIHSAADYVRLQERLKGKAWRGTPLRSVSIRKYVAGSAVSMALCITGQGIVLSGPQRQLIDLPYCADFTEDGVFCGHVWDEPAWPLSVTEKARTQARIIGGHLATRGYRGIVGIDFVMDLGQERVYPIELNPRFTGAFPMLSLLHLKSGLIPMEAFHLLEFMGLPYEVDVEELNVRYAEPVTGSHLLLFLLSRGKGRPLKGLDAGLYECDRDGEKGSFVRGGVDYEDIRNERQFIVIDGPPDTGGAALQSVDPHYRLCRLLFSYPVADEAGVLSGRALRAVEWVYHRIMGGDA